MLSVMNDAANINKPPPEIDLDSYTDMSVGQILRRTREHYGQTLDDVEQNLRIRANQLDAIEKLDLEALPGRVYAIGFVRSYADYLGLDGDKMVHLFKAQSVGRNATTEHHFPVSAVESKVPNAYVIIGTVVALVLLIAFWTIFHAPAKTKEAIPPVPEVLLKGNAALLEPTPEPVEVKPAIPEKDRMELIVKADSWVEIKNAKRKTILRQVLKPNDRYVVPDEEGLTITTGNAGGIIVHINGKELVPLGKLAEVKRNIPLSFENFRPKDTASEQ